MSAFDPLLTAPFTADEIAEKANMTFGVRPAPIAARVPASTWTWVARITGRHSQYQYEREFLHKVNGEYVLDAGIYEGCIADGSRQFLTNSGNGSLATLDQADVAAIF